MPEHNKLYVLDTNVLVHDPTALFSFEGVTVGIPSTVLEELDKFKKEGTEKGRNTREVIRVLDEMRQQGSLREGVPLPNGSILKILFTSCSFKQDDWPFRLDAGDNEILFTAASYRDEGYTVSFISKDLNARLKADALGLETQDYVHEYITQDDFYRGWVRVPVPAVELTKDVPSIFESMLASNGIRQNQFVVLESQNNPHNYRIFRYCGGKKFKPVNTPRLKWPLKARNPQQEMALDLLLDQDIAMVCLFGPAGTGKTFLALLAGLHQVLVNDEYERLLISRPVVPLGRDIGYLPGTVEEKLHSWMMPVYDNMDFIFREVHMAEHFETLNEGDYDRKGHERKGRHQKKKGRSALRSIEDLVHRGKLSMEAITYMRGRSIPYQYILIDEVQNLTLHEVKTLVSRVGQGSKIILAGDPYQIDSPHLDFSSNGLVQASERFKGQKLFGSVYLEQSERSELSQLAGELL